jgi:hypothetical protein
VSSAHLHAEAEVSTEARVIAQVEARSWRRHAGYQPKVAASARHAVARHWSVKSGVCKKR